MSPIDPRSGELFGTGRIPPSNIDFDYSIMDNPSPLHLPSPHHHSPHRIHFDFHNQPSRITEESTISSDSTGVQVPQPTAPMTPVLGGISRSASRPSHRRSIAAQEREDQQDREEQHQQDHREGARRKSSIAADPLFRPRAIDFAEMLENNAPCIFDRKDCTQMTRTRPVCYDCHERVQRMRERRSRILRKLLIVIWVAIQSGIVAMMVYLIMAAKHKREMKQILDQVGQI